MDNLLSNITGAAIGGTMIISLQKWPIVMSMAVFLFRIYMYIYMDICNIICIQTILMAFFMTLGLESWRFLPKFVTWKHELKCLKPVRCCTLTILLGATDNTKQALLAPWKGTFIKAQFVRVCCITSTQITPWNSGCLPLKNRGGLEDSTCFFIFTVFFF